MCTRESHGDRSMLIDLPSGVFGGIACHLSPGDIGNVCALNTVMRHALPPPPAVDVHTLAARVAKQSAEWWTDVRRGVEGDLRAGNRCRQMFDCLSVCTLRDMGFTLKDVRDGYPAHEWGAITVALAAHGLNGRRGREVKRRPLKGLSIQDVGRLVACAW
jgi:hypothetical protein